jgi:hypothetical protein
MTLTASAFWRDPATGEFEEFTDWEDGHYMAAVERARRNLWGSEPVQRRGAKGAAGRVRSESRCW